jgi:hypothetical protein
MMKSMPSGKKIPSGQLPTGLDAMRASAKTWGFGKFALVGVEDSDGVRVYDVVQSSNEGITHYYVGLFDDMLRRLTFEYDYPADNACGAGSFYQEIRWYDYNQPVVLPPGLPQ